MFYYDVSYRLLTGDKKSLKKYSYLFKSKKQMNHLQQVVKLKRYLEFSHPDLTFKFFESFAELYKDDFNSRALGARDLLVPSYK